MVLAADADYFKGTAKLNNKDSRLIKFTENQSFIGFKEIDLNHLEKITISIDPNKRKGWFEIRLGNFNGPIIGKTPEISDESRPENYKEKWFDYSIRLEQTDKVSDIYLLFQTETGVDIWTSFLMNSVYFENKK